MENRLKELCADNLEMKEKYYIYCQIKKKFTERLRTVPAYFPHFSIHDGSHSVNIIKYLGLLLGQENIKKLSASDLFIICVSAYTHDISMSISYEMIHDKMTSDDWKKKLIKYTKSEQEDLAEVAERLLRFPEVEKDIISLDIYSDVIYIIEETFRKEHAERSAKEIVADNDLENLFGIRIRNILAEVCRLHGCNVLDIMELPYEENGIFDDHIHPRFDAALLALGDLLDMDTERFDKDFLKAATPMLNLSEIHKQKHESITHFLVKNGIIEIKSNCNSLEVYRAMRDWIDWIKQITEFMSVNWNKIAPDEVSGAPSLNKYEILLNNDTKWLEFADVKFEISTKHALKLLGSTALYKSKYTFVRELIQNAVDATMKRIYLIYLEREEEKDDKAFLEWILENINEILKFQIDITLSIENKKVKFVIEDKGTGISREDIKKIASVEGKSDDEREFIGSMPEFFRPSGTFGIGLQSVFAVADYFEVVTRTEEEKTKKITFQDAKDGRGYINVTDSKRRNSIGTTVTVFLNPDRFDQEYLGINDYAFKVRPKEELIYYNLVSEINNWDSNVPAVSMRQQKKEYIPVTIKNLENKIFSFIPEVILKYKCIFEDCIFTKAKDNYLDITYMKSSINYSYYDVENSCIFNAFLYSSHEDENVLQSDDNLKQYPKYGNTIFYRNSFVESNYNHGTYFGKDRFLKYIDYSINILSSSSDAILTLERRGVKDSFKPQLDNLLNVEFKQLIQYTVDSLLKRDNDISSSLLLIIYQAAKVQKYKSDELREKYKSKLKMLKIGGYRKFNTKKEVTFSAYQLTNKELVFVRKYNNIYSNLIKNCDPKFSQIIKKNTTILDLDAPGAENHPLNHRIKTHFIYKIQDIIYEAFTAEPYLKQDDKSYERDGFFKREQILEMLFTNRRCILAWPGYEELQTYINLGLRIYGNILEKQVEMQLDSKIRREISMELQQKGYIANCRERYLDSIVDSETYKTNLKYIQNESEIDNEKIAKKYKKLWDEILTLFEDDKFSDFVKAKAEEWSAERSGFNNSVDIEGFYFTK